MTDYQYQKGDKVRATRRIDMNWNYEGVINEGDEGVVTSVKSRNSIRVKFEHANYVKDIYIPNGQIEPIDPAMVAEAEKLYTPQEGDILPDDPRLAWLWRAAAREATRVNHCREYDDLCDALGIPGRDRPFTIKFTVNGMSLSTTIKAQSKVLAEKKILETFQDSVLA